MNYACYYTEREQCTTKVPTHEFSLEVNILCLVKMELEPYAVNSTS